MNIPVFNNTEEAIDFGKSMDEIMVPIFMDEHKKHYEESKRLRLENKWNEAMVVAVKGQFYREAVESFLGKVNRRKK